MLRGYHLDSHKALHVISDSNFAPTWYHREDPPCQRASSGRSICDPKLTCHAHMVRCLD